MENARQPKLLMCAAAGREIFASHLEMILKRQVMLGCEIRLTRNDGMVLHGQLQSIGVTIENKADYILSSIVDVTVHKQLEEKLQNAHDQLALQTGLPYKPRVIFNV
ncbi:MAG: hypothetical protein VB050_06355 [Geobacteraceae bacterium]|nr:hypothetical protein [Geobacteraceae bacterium]